MAYIDRFKFHYQKDFTDQIPYEGREFEAALYQKDGAIAFITLNRPEKRNAIDDNVFLDLMAGLHAAREDDEVRVVVIRGAGLSFSSGHDLSGPSGQETPPVPPTANPTVRDYLNVERRRCGKYEDLLHFPKPTIAQVHGACIGAGEFIHASCDFTIAADDAIFGASGFGRYTGGVQDWPLWPVGSERFRAGKLTLEITGQEAAELGLVNRSVPLDDLDDEVRRWADRLAVLPADSLLLAREWLNGTLDVTGIGVAWRSHYAGHLAIQWIRFQPDEVNFYKARRDRGLRGYFATRAVQATAGAE
ncbi:MAG: enoyl-CoA hydratase/isomerase family protein [Chloroflexi bacterium]|nr:enoyl-CoA hydratase/isomerase family protein [Chloroflexota bacterium]